MAKNNEQKIIFLIVALGLITVGTFLLKNAVTKAFNNSNNTNTSNLNKNELVPEVENQLVDKISTGEKFVIDLNPSNSKQSGAQAYARKNYEEAISQWSESLKEEQNDPETLIYQNNARIGKQQAHSIAVPVPVEAEVNVAKEMLRGTAQAQYEINQNGGINNKPIKIIIANDRNNPKTAKELALNFSQDDSILGVVGHFSSNVTLEAAQIYETQGLVMVSPTSSSVALSNVGSYVFRTVSSDCFTGNALVEYLTNNLKVKQAALLYNSASSYSASMRDVFQSSLEAKGGEIVAEFNFNEPNFSIADTFNKIKEKKAKALVLFPNSSGMNTLETLDKTLLITQMNQGELPLLGSDSLHKPRTLQLGRASIENMVLAVPWQIRNSNVAFSKTAKKLWGYDVNWRTILTYDATMAIATAIKVSPSREGIKQALLDPDFSADGASGKIKFLPTGDRAAEVDLVKVVAGNNSGFGYDFIPVSDAKHASGTVCK